MPRFAANLSMMFQEHEFLDRFRAARAAGFAGVEFLFPYDFPAEDIAARLQQAGLAQVLFNLPPGEWAKGERGLAALPGREEEFRHSIETALAYAEALECRTLHCMAGMVPPGVEREHCERALTANLRIAARACAEAGRTLVIEPINTRDMAGYFLNYQGQARAIIEEVAEPNLKLQLDLYHCQIMEGDLARHIRELAHITGHVQIAGVPDRQEPDQGEVNYRYLFDVLDETGYQGWIGCEYRPRGRTTDGLGWFTHYSL